MDILHNSIGCIGVLALLVVIMHHTSQVVVNASSSVCDAVKNGKRRLDTMALDRGVPNLDNHRLRGVCTAVKRTGHCVYNLLELVASARGDDHGGYTLH